jgi:hypothetical protein
MSERFLAGVLGLALLAPTSVAGQDWRTITSMCQQADEDLLRVEVQYGAGRFEVGSGSGSTLYRASLRYDSEVFSPRIAYQSGLLRLGLDDLKVRGRNLRSGHLRLDLTRNVPLELKLEFGAARAELDLGGLRIRQARIATGASETDLTFSSPNTEACRLLELEVGAAQFRARQIANLNAERLTLAGGVGEVDLDFTGQWQRNLTADIKMGLGSLTLRVPRGLGLRVRKGGLLVGFDSQGLVKRGDVYYSENWDDAERKLTVNVDAALGSVRVTWVDNESDR